MLRRSAQPVPIESIGSPPQSIVQQESRSHMFVSATHNLGRSVKARQGSGSVPGKDGPVLNDLPVVIDRNIAELQEYELALCGAQEDPVIHL